MNTKESSTRLSICDDLCRINGCKAVWSANNQICLSASSASKTKGGGHLNDENIALHIVEWNAMINEPLFRKLTNEARGIFVGLQKICGHSGNVAKSQLAKYSIEYRSVLKDCAEEARILLESSADISDNQQEESTLRDALEIFEMSELLWSLCEIIFVTNKPGGLVLPQLLNWLRLHFVHSDVRVGQVLAADRPPQHVEYWPTIYSSLLQGNMRQAAELLELSYNPQTSKHYVEVLQLISDMPLYSSKGLTPFVEFETNWQRWQERCQRLATDDRIMSDENLAKVVMILCGNDDVFMELQELVGAWYCLMISRLLYQCPMVKATELQYHAKFCVDMYNGRARLQPWDQIILSAVELDINEVIRECCASFNNWWLVSHLTDLLHHCGGVLEPKTYHFGSNLREFLLREYASSLLTSDSLWQVGIDYLEYCPVFGRSYIARYLECIPLETQWKTFKILHLCEKYELHELYHSICRTVGMKEFRSGNNGSALGWALRAKDSRLATVIAEKLLDEYRRTGDFSDLDLIDDLGSSLLLSDSLAFLGKYRKFHRLYSMGRAVDASSLLVSLLTSDIVPRKFWFHLLVETIPFFNTKPVLFKEEESYALLKCVEDMELNHKLNTDIQMTEEDRERVELVRLCLARNLSKIHVLRETATN